MAVTRGNKIGFVYVGAGKTMPATPDPDSVYFVEDAQKLYVGGQLIADATDLSPYTVKSVTISGEGGNITGAEFNSSTGVLTLTKGATAMLAANGTATGATITLAADPSADMHAATKKYVDDAVEGLSGAMHFIGVSTTAITDGGTQTPTIGGKTVTPAQGDVVLYGDKEFIWNGSSWTQLGDESSFALKTTSVSAGTGLTGGGTLAADRTINHQDKPSSGSSALPSAVSGLEVVSDVSIDSLGHVASASKADLSTAVDSAIDAKINALDVAQVGGSSMYLTTISETDGKISATAASKGSILENNANLVDGGTVYTAIQQAIEDAKPVWEVV